MKSIKAPGGGVYRQDFYKCNKERCKKCRDGPGHGPYWSRYWWEDGKTKKEYIGKNLPKHVLTKDEALPKILTKDTPPPSESLPKTNLPKTPEPLTKDKSSLPKTDLPKTDEEVVRRAIAAIKDFHLQGVEPTVEQIAEIVGRDKRPLGRLLKAAGYENKPVWRLEGKVKTKARRYLIPTK